MIKIIIWGANNNSVKKTLRYINLNNVEIKAFTDNDAAKWENLISLKDYPELDDKKIKSNGEPKHIISPSCLEDIQFDYIVITSTFFKEIKQQLINMNIPKDRIILLPTNIFLADDELIYKLKNKKYKDRYSVYQQIFNLDQPYFNLNRDMAVMYRLEACLKEDDLFHIKDIKIPYAVYEKNPQVFLEEFFDILQQYAFDKELHPYSEGPYEYSKVLIEKDDTVFDLGANFGLFSSLAAVKGKIVYAFEPVASVRELLEITAENYDNINVIPYAASDSTQKELIDITMLENRPGSASMVLDRAKEGEGRLTMEIEAVTLDDFIISNKIDKLDFIKADIEGAERNMLQGAVKTIQKFTPKLSIRKYHLADDPEVIKKLIANINRNYVIEENWLTIYAYVPQ